MPDDLVQHTAPVGKPYALHAAWLYADVGGAPTLSRDTTVLVDQGRTVEV